MHRRTKWPPTFDWCCCFTSLPSGSAGSRGRVSRSWGGGWGLTTGQREVTGPINLEWEHAVVQWGQALQPDLNCFRHLSLPASGPSKWFLMTNWKPPHALMRPLGLVSLWLLKVSDCPTGPEWSGWGGVQCRAVPSSSRVGLILIHGFLKEPTQRVQMNSEEGQRSPESNNWWKRVMF